MTMTNQETFDRVAKSLLAQGCPSMSDYTGCRYRLELADGTVLKCAIGHLIPDSEYHTDLETRAVDNIAVRYLPSLQGLDIQLLASLQDAHDGIGAAKYDWLRLWLEDMRAVAKQFGLSSAVLPTSNPEGTS